jgi:hypothetical protein
MRYNALMAYVVKLSDNPGREELKWAMRFTVRMRDNYTCQGCGTPGRDVAHILSRADRPDLEFDPDNARVLCRPCHVAADHKAGHRPSGRPIGLKHKPETIAKMREAQREIANRPEVRAERSKRAKALWDRQGRYPERDCENCGQPLDRILLSRKQRFCGTVCRYAFQTGKPRSGW